MSTSTNLNNLKHRVLQYFRILGAQLARPLSGTGGSVAPESCLSVKHFSKDGTLVKDYGIVSTKVVTTAFVNFLVDQFQTETSEIGDINYHDSGTGTTAEAVGDTALVTKVETGRAAGTQGEGASANIYQSVGTISYTGTRAITEHGIFTQASGGTLVDRSVFSAINVTNGDSIQFTYELTVPAGS